MEDLSYWALLGGIAVFFYAWRRTKASSDRARKIIDSASQKASADREYALGYFLGLRLMPALLFSFFGAIAGASIWGLLILLQWLLGDRKSTRLNSSH